MPRIAQMKPQARAISPIRAENPAEMGLGGGEGGIRTLGTGYPVRQISICKSQFLTLMSLGRKSFLDVSFLRDFARPR